MCLSYNETLTLKITEDMSEEMICYKVFRLRKGFLSSPYQNNVWGELGYEKQIIAKSDRGNKELSMGEKASYNIFEGIHVFLTIAGAIQDRNSFQLNCSDFSNSNYLPCKYIVLPVVCKKKDLVAAGYYLFVQSAVVMEVTINNTPLFNKKDN